MPTVALARNAMATRFEIVLNGDDPVALRAAGEEALAEIEYLEAQLSLFRPTSEIAHLNARAARGPVRVTPAVFALIEHARKLTNETGGAFDITIAPLVRCWGFMGGSGRQPSAEDLVKARESVGMHLVRCNPEDFTISFAREGVMLDLGAIGKGYAVERAAEILREAGVTSALVHGGTSTVYALGSPPGAEFWQVAIEAPSGSGPLGAGSREGSAGDGERTALRNFQGQSDFGHAAGRDGPRSGSESPFGGRGGAPEKNAQEVPLARVQLRDEALSVSAVWGKFFERQGKLLGHVIDPRTAQPVSAALLAVVVLPSATETDALSTALLTLGLDGHSLIARLRPGMRTLVAASRDGQIRFAGQGITPPSNQKADEPPNIVA